MLRYRDNRLAQSAQLFRPPTASHQESLCAPLRSRTRRVTVCPTSRRRRACLVLAFVDIHVQQPTEDKIRIIISFTQTHNVPILSTYRILLGGNTVSLGFTISSPITTYSLTMQNTASFLTREQELSVNWKVIIINYTSNLFPKASLDSPSPDTA